MSHVRGSAGHAVGVLVLLAAAGCADPKETATGADTARQDTGRYVPPPPPPPDSDSPTGETADTASDNEETGDTDTDPTPPVGIACVQPPVFGPPVRALPQTLPVPTWEVTGADSIFSSPRVEDLDGDGELEIVIGHGTEYTGSSKNTTGYTTARSAVTGATLWTAEAHDEVVGSAAFTDVDLDGVTDVIIGGRQAELRALSGIDGTPLWVFPGTRKEGWLNFYTAQLIPDLDGDSIDDLVVANGGDTTVAPYEPRPEGHLAVLSGATGGVLGVAPTPDRMETYMSPAVVQWVEEGPLEVVFGTGGETWGGAVWRTPLQSILDGDIDDAVPLLESPDRGAVAPPTLADLNGDCVPDTIAVTYAGLVAAIDGATDVILWQHHTENGESWGEPALGFFTGDGVPDVAVSFSIGVWPFYVASRHLVIDGASGDILWEDDFSTMSSGGHVTADLDGDGLDELFIQTFDDLTYSTLHLVQPLAGNVTVLGETVPEVAIPTLWLGDLDADDQLDLLQATSSVGEESTWTMKRYELGVPVPEPLTWSGYLGPDRTAALPAAK